MDYKRRSEAIMIIEINKDIDRYQESLVMGLSAKQVIYSVLSVAIGGGIVYLVYPYLGLTGAAYVAIPVVAPIALSGFYTFNGRSFAEVMKKRVYYMFGNRPLLYRSEEGEAAIREYQMQKINEEKLNIKKNKRKGRGRSAGKGKR